MEVIRVKEEEKEKWDDFVKVSPNSSLLQSWFWGEFQKSLKKKIWKLAVKNKEWLALALLIKHKLPFNKSYLYCPRGPLVKSLKLRIENLKLLFKKIEEIAQRENSIFLRIDPAVQINQWTNLEKFGFLKAKKEIQPKDTLILDITKSENELLSQMHYKTRYNLRLAERKGVKIRKTTNLKEIDVFWNLLCETTKREKFKSHPKEYYKKQLEVLGKEGLIRLFLAQYKNKVIAASLVSFFGKRATYLHGASLYQYRKVMAPHLLQWKAILEAKKQNCQFYDFWGIAPLGREDHPWSGITRFKKGFGGKEVHYLGAWDLVYQPFWYRIYNIAKQII